MVMSLSQVDSQFRQGLRIWQAFGRLDGASPAQQDVWDGNSIFSTYPFLTVAKKLRVVSASADDNPAGLGTGVLVVDGLDAEFKEIREVFILNGQTQVDGLLDFLRVNRATCVTAGAASTAFENIGLISIGTEDTVFTTGAYTSGDLLAQIKPTFGISQAAVFTVPFGFKALPLSDRATGTTNGHIALFKVKRPGETWLVVDQSLGTIADGVEFALPAIDESLLWTPGTDVKVSAGSVAGAGSIFAGFNLLLQKFN